MIKPQDFFGSSPKTVLNKPFFHCQDQKAYNVDGGTSIADAWTKRTLNTVIYNDIQGASLGTDAVNLPAGTYYVEGYSPIHANGSGDENAIVAVFKDNAKQLQGSGNHQNNSTAAQIHTSVSGVITLTVPGTIDLRYFVGLGKGTNGLGYSNNTGSITDASINSIYADLKIWQLDRSLEIAPKAINSGLQTISGMNTEGNIMGFDVTVSGNTLTITKGSCMSSDLTAVLAFTANKTCVLPATVNGDFYVFAVRLVDGVTFEARAYSTYAGPSSDAQIDKWRLVSFAKNNGSGVTMSYIQNGNRIDWLGFGSNSPTYITSTTSGYTAYNISTIIPVLCKCFEIIGTTSMIQVSYNGTDLYFEMVASNATSKGLLPYRDGIYLKTTGTAGQSMRVSSATLRR